MVNLLSPRIFPSLAYYRVIIHRCSFQQRIKPVTRAHETFAIRVDHASEIFTIFRMLVGMVNCDSSLISYLPFTSIRKIVTYLARSCDGRAAGARGNRLPSNCKPLTSLVGHGTRLLTLTLLYYHPPSIFFYTIFRLSPLLFSPCQPLRFRDCIAIDCPIQMFTAFCKKGSFSSGMFENTRTLEYVHRYSSTPLHR